MRRPFFFLPLLFFFCSISSVLAEEGRVSLEDFPQQLANAFDTSLFVGKLLASLILLGIVLFPTMFLVKGKQGAFYVIVIFGLSVLGIDVALGWLPVWSFAVILMFIAFGSAIIFSRYGG